MHSSPGRSSDRDLSSNPNLSSRPNTQSQSQGNNSSQLRQSQQQQNSPFRNPGTPNQARLFSRSDLAGPVPDYNQYLGPNDLSSSSRFELDSNGDNNGNLRSGGVTSSDRGISGSSTGNSNTGSSNNNTSTTGIFTSDSNSNSNSTSFQDLEIRSGTQIKPRETIQLFSHFFQTFQLPGSEEKYYLSKLHEILSSSITVLNLDLSHIHMHEHGGSQLFEALVYFPTTTIPIADFVINQLANDLRTRWERTAQDQHLLRQSTGDNILMNSESDARSDGQLNNFGLLSGGMESDQNQIQSIYHPYSIIVRPYGLALMNSRQLQPHDIDGLVSIRGIVLRVSTLKPELKLAMFPCNTQGCDNIVAQEVNDGRLKQPTFCQTCNKRDSFYLAHNMSRYASKQVIRIQEVPEDISDGETPHTISICAYDELVDTVKPGDRIVVTGIFRGQNIRLNPNQRRVKSNLFTYIDAFHFKMVSAATKAQTNDTQGELNQNIGLGLNTLTNTTDTTLPGNQTGQPHVAPTLEQEYIFLLLANRPDIYPLLARSIAPSVWGLDDVKKGLLTQLVGGNNLEGDSLSNEDNNDMNDMGDSGTKKRGKRGVVHVLLVGDPGTAKSQLLQYIHKLTTRGVYTSGTASSAAGLTASVLRDPVQNEAVLEPGALVLSDCDICCIDEFDKMSASAQSILHEAMEQQTVSIAKAGVICSLSARTTILASANPRDSRYNPNLSIVQNIDLPPTLLSRFDLIYIVLDTPNPTTDERLAEHLLSLFMSEEDRTTFRESNIQKIQEIVGPPPPCIDQHGHQLQLPINDSGEEYLPTEELMQYINYARTLIPLFTADACNELEDCYLNLRGSADTASTSENMGNGILSSSISGGANTETTISATPRQLQSLIRISEALAKLRLRDVVLPADVREASRLIRTATLSAAIDPTTGKIDMSALNTGVSSVDKALISTGVELAKNYYTLRITQQSHNINDLIAELSRQNQHYTVDVIHKILEELVRQEFLEWSPHSPTIRLKMK